jgi:hypothetical protein
MQPRHNAHRDDWRSNSSGAPPVMLPLLEMTVPSTAMHFTCTFRSNRSVRASVRVSQMTAEPRE